MVAKKRLLPFNEVTKLFTDKNYNILITENEYIGNTCSIKFECNQGHINETTVSALKNEHGCSICSGNKKLTYDFVKEQFEEAGFIMITKEYVNARTKMNVNCSNGHNINITYDDFLQSKSTGRWWMQTHNNEWTPCSYKDYLIASDNEIPERWLRALERE